MWTRRSNRGGDVTDEPLTGRFARLAQEGLDVDENKARDAAGVLGRILRNFHHCHIELEQAASALDRSAPASNRATDARDHIGIALNGCHDVIGSLADAQDALDFHWNHEPAS
jgi:hypothetical protein